MAGSAQKSGTSVDERGLGLDAKSLARALVTRARFSSGSKSERRGEGSTVLLPLLVNRGLVKHVIESRLFSKLRLSTSCGEICGARSRGRRVRAQ